MKTPILTTLLLVTNLLPVAASPIPTPIHHLAQADDNPPPTPQQVKQIAKNITVRITAENNGGSGVLIAQKGNTYLVLTNAHVVKRATQIKIQAPDGQKYTATPIDGGFDAKYDLALLQFTSRTKYTLANLETVSPLTPTRTIYSAGFPFDSTEIRLTSGEVSQLSDIPFDDGTQIGYMTNQGEKGIRQGMSGGAILDSQGVLLGINTVGAAPILPNYTYVDGSKPLPKLAAQYRNANWGVPVYNFLIQVKPDILYGYKFNGLDVSTIQHQVTPTGYMARLNDKARKMTVRIEAGGANGSGVIVAKEGNSYYVLTAKHVVEDLDKKQLFTDTKIITYDQDNYSPTSTVVAEGLDLAVVKFTSKSEYSVAEISQYYPNTDDIVFAVGFPGRNRINSPLWQWQLNPGFIFDPETGKFRTQNNQSFSNGYDLIYSNISHGGMSGGPIFDTAGKIIAIHGTAEAIGNIQLGNSQGISIQTFIGIADKLKVNRQLLKIANTKPAILNATDRQVVIKVMENLAAPQVEDDGERWLAYANQLYRTRQYDKSIAAFDIAIAKGKELEGNYGKALSLWKTRKIELAEVTIRRAIEAVSQSNRANYYYFWAKQSAILRDSGKYDMALEAIEVAIKLDPKDRRSMNEKALLLSKNRQYTAAITIYDEMIRERAEGYSYLNRGLAKLNSGDKQGAIVDYNQAIKINPNDAMYYSNRGIAKSKLGDDRGAISDFNQAIEIDSGNPIYYNERGLAKGSLGDKQDAITDFNRAIKLIFNNDLVYIYVNRGDAQLYLGNKQQSITDYKQAIKIYSQEIKNNPNFYLYYLERGNVNYKIENIQEANIDYNRVIKLNPSLGEAYAGRANVKYKLGKKQEASMDYNRAIKLDPSLGEAYVGRGIIKYDLGNKQDALADFNQAIILNPDLDGAYHGRGNIKYVLGNKQDALSDFNQAIVLNPNLDGAYVSRGLTKFDLGNRQEAITDFSRAISINNKNIKAYNNRCRLKLILGDKQGAITDCDRAIFIDPKYAQAYINRGNAKSDSGQKQAAITDYDRAITLDSNFKEAYINRGNTKSDLGQKQAAIADYDRAISIDTKYAPAYMNRGNAKSDLGQKQAAIADYDRSISLNPNSADAYNSRGQVRLALGQKQDAIADYDRAILLDPNFAQAYNNRGWVRAGLGQKQAAIVDYDRSISLDSNEAKFYVRRGIARYDLGNKKGAIADFSQTIKINPNFPVAYYIRGIAKADLGDKQGAIDDYSKAAELHRQQGDIEGYQQAIGKIAKLKGN
jgi:tetratricopeptide (TPR) repeat protein/S1-C subfamily serine protease